MTKKTYLFILSVLMAVFHTNNVFSGNDKATSKIEENKELSFQKKDFLKNLEEMRKENLVPKETIDQMEIGVKQMTDEEFKIFRTNTTDPIHGARPMDVDALKEFIK